MSEKKRKGKRAGRWRRRLGSWAAAGSIAAVVGLVVFVVVYGQMSGGGGGGDKFVADVVETPSDPSAAQPFQGGPRLYFPVQTVDLGQVPFMKEVSHSFDLKNVGDAALHIQDVQVKMLEGC